MLDLATRRSADPAARRRRRRRRAPVDRAPAARRPRPRTSRRCGSACSSSGRCCRPPATLAGAGIGYRVLKGPAVAHLDYADPAQRAFGDVDVLVESTAYDDALGVLAASGARRRYTEVRPGFDRRWGKGACLVAADGTQIDVHRTFVAGPFGLTIDLDELFAAPSGGDRRRGHPGARPREPVPPCVLPRRARRSRGAARRAPRRRPDDPDHGSRPGRGDGARRSGGGPTRSWRRAVRLAWARLALAPHPWSTWAAEHQADRFQTRALRAYTSESRSYATQVAAGLSAVRSGPGEGGVHARAAARGSRAPRRAVTAATTAGCIGRGARSAPPGAHDELDRRGHRCRPPPKTGGDILREAPKWVQALMMVLAAVWVIMVGAMLFSGSFNLLRLRRPAARCSTLITMPHRAPHRARRTATRRWSGSSWRRSPPRCSGRSLATTSPTSSYVSVGDAEEYHAFGKYLVPYYRSFDFSPDVGPIPGTGFLKMVTGILYSVAGSSKLGAFTVFAWLGFIGLLLLLARVQARGAERRRQALRAARPVPAVAALLVVGAGQGRVGARSGSGICAYGVARVMTRKRVHRAPDPGRRARGRW